MDVDAVVSSVAAAIAEPARTRMLYCLMDGRARTSTELAVVAGVSPATASVHLARLKLEQLVKVHAQGRHRYYSLQGPSVGTALEKLMFLAGGERRRQRAASTPARLTTARTCYDHMAGRVAVSLHQRLTELRWLQTVAGEAYDLSAKGMAGLVVLGIDVEATRALRRRFACACLDWSERQPHLGGALGAALLTLALRRRWVRQDLDSRALKVTESGWRMLRTQFGITEAG